MSVVRTNTTNPAARTGANPTFSHTSTAGANLYLVVSIFSGSDNVTAVTYNGVTMNQLVKGGDTVGGETLYIYGLPNPSTGSNTVAITCPVTVTSGAATYSGVSQATTPDNTVAQTQTTNTSITATLSTTASGCFLFGQGAWSGGTTSAGSGTTLIADAGNGTGICESNPLQVASTGSNSLILTSGASPSWGLVVVAL